MLSEEAQQLLISLLSKQNLVDFNSLSSEPIIVTRGMLTHIDREQLSHHLGSLLRDYARVTFDLMDKARKPFYITVDLLPEHFKDASDLLDLMEDCIRKISTLLKRSVQFTSPNMIIQVTIDADSVIEEKVHLCRFLAEEKGKYRIESSDPIKRAIKGKFTNAKKTLDTFLSKIPKH